MGNQYLSIIMPDDHDKILCDYWLTEYDSDSDSATGNSSSSTDTEDHMVEIAAIFIGLIVGHTLVCMAPLYNKTPYHTSALTGEMWVLELINGHPERIRNELGVCKDIFLGLRNDLYRYGHRNSKHVTLEEQLAIFLYTCVTGLSI
jgi:hypothetical protein